jgi:ABC-type amino acid transport substrate-binding protein
MRVGITHNPPWTDTSSSGPVTGSEVTLLEEFAESRDAEIDWVEGSEGVLADALREGDIDVAIGGFTDDTPWTEKAAVSAAYREVRNDRGVMEKHVVLSRLGENRLLVELEEFLRKNGAGR